MLDRLLAFDAAAAKVISGLAGWTPLDLFFSAITLSGVWASIWAVLGLALALRHRGSVAEGFVRLIWSLLLASLVAIVVIKPFIARVRPDVSGLARSTAAVFATSWTGGHSFPSGHAAQAVAGAYALALMWPRRRRAWYALAAIMTISRVYLGVHYPLDVIGGALVGWATARFATARTPCYISKSANPVLRVPR
jgi:undecaprenyl-diphosphatase